MIWGAMSCRGAAVLFSIPPNTTMNGLKYMELQRQAEISHACPRLHENGVPCHQLKVATDFPNQKQKISVLELPENSPDLNPIENLWTIMKDKLAYK